VNIIEPEKFTKNKNSQYYIDDNMETHIIFCQEFVKISNNKISNNSNLAKLLVCLYDYFYESKAINIDNFENTVLIGHFHADITEVRIFFEKACETATEEEKEKLRRFEDPIMGRGDFIIDSYTLGAIGPWNKGATDIINQIKVAKEKKRIKSLFIELFDFFWYQHKLPELISNIKGHLFMRVQSGGKCGTNELQDSIAEFKECEEILRHEYEVKEDLSLIYKLAKPSNQELNHEEIKEVDTQLDRILLAILKKRDGEKSATKIEG
jgi:hypothetical protein